MKTKLLDFFILFFFFFFNTQAQTNLFDWVRQIGGYSNERGTAIEMDSNENIYCTGELAGTAYFPDTTFVTNFGDVFLAKFTNDGELLWVRTCGGDDLDRGLDLKIDNNDNAVITGFFSDSASFGDTILVCYDEYDVFVAKYDSDGNFLWVAQGAGGGDDEGLCLAIDQSDNIFVSGSFEDSLKFGTHTLSTPANDPTVFLTKISPAGTPLWAEQTVSPDFGISIVNDIICDSNGDVIFTGYFDQTITFQDTTFSSNSGSEDIFLAKYNTNGNKIWILHTGSNSPYRDCGNAVAVDQSNNVYFTGEFANTVTFGDSTFTSTDIHQDLFFAKLTPDGIFQWVKRSIGAGREFPLSLYYNQQNGIMICGGYSDDFTIGDSTFYCNLISDIFLATFTTSGDFKNALSIGNLGYDNANDGLLSNDNKAFIIGRFETSIYFGDTLLTSVDIADVFMTKINLNVLTAIPDTRNNLSPQHYSLSQNYPNPFNPSTKISYSLPKQSFLELKLYDVLGKEIKTLIAGTKPAGRYEYTLSGADLASGVYFIQMTAGNFGNVRKILLIK